MTKFRSWGRLLAEQRKQTLGAEALKQDDIFSGRAKPGMMLLFSLWGMFAGVGVYTFHYAEGFSYFSADPRACTELLKAQHPEFELWSQGIHARSGVACADCHMPYMRQGASKISDHWVRSPLLNINRACQTCHHFPEDELKARAYGIQEKNHELTKRAGEALTDLLDAVARARDAGATEEQLKEALELQRKAQWRLDFIAAENSMGFHAPQEAARILGEAADYARQGQSAALAWIVENGSGTIGKSATRQ